MKALTKTVVRERGVTWVIILGGGGRGETFMGTRIQIRMVRIRNREKIFCTSCLLYTYNN
jgi:hypothetical protein